MRAGLVEVEVEVEVGAGGQVAGVAGAWAGALGGVSMTLRSLSLDEKAMRVKR